MAILFISLQKKEGSLLSALAFFISLNGEIGMDAEERKCLAGFGYKALQPYMFGCSGG